MGQLLGRTLVASLPMSFRIEGSQLRRDLGWRPTRPCFRDAVPKVAAATP